MRFPETFPRLETERLVLRQISQEDAAGVFAFRSDPEVQRYNGGAITDLGEAIALIAELETGFRNNTMVEWGVTIRGGDDRVLGIFGFANWSQAHRRAEIGYCLHRDYWRQGFAEEALRAIIAFGFEKMNLNRIHACPRVENFASTRILEKLGFTLEGILRDEFWDDGAFRDEAHYALLRRDYLGRSAGGRTNPEPHQPREQKRVDETSARRQAIEVIRTFRCTACGALNRVPAPHTGTPVCGRCKARLDTSGAPQDVGEAEFTRTVESAPVPVLVDFWAPWCGPCRMAAPLVDRVAREYAGRLIVLKVNSDESPAISSRYGIQSIPTFMVFRDGREASRQVGLPPPASFAEWIASSAT